MHFRFIDKKAIIFEEYVDFGDVHKGMREIAVVNPSISHAQMRSLDFTDDEIDTNRSQNISILRSAITSEVDRGILHPVHSPTGVCKTF